MESTADAQPFASRAVLADAHLFTTHSTPSLPPPSPPQVDSSGTGRIMECDDHEVRACCRLCVIGCLPAACRHAASRVMCCIPCALWDGPLRRMPLQAFTLPTPRIPRPTDPCPLPLPRPRPQAVLITTYVRTGCWLLPHLQDRFDIELLPPPPLGHVAGAGQQQQQQGAAGRADSGSRSGASSSRDGSEAGSRFQAGGPDAGSGGAEQEEGEQGRQGRGRAGASGSGGGSGTGVGAAADLVALGIRLKGCKVVGGVGQCRLACAGVTRPR